MVTPSAIIDVGANVGQISFEYRQIFPTAKVYALEPDPEIFRELKANLAGDPKAFVFNIGLGSTHGHVRFENRSNHHTIHHIAEDQNDASLPFVEITTMDRFCADRAITHVDVLKIDTEGHDLDVIRGADSLIASAAIDVIISECSLLTSDHERLVPFAAIHQYMSASNYHFFGLYDQAPHWQGKELIEYANCAYISPTMLNRVRSAR